jgi:hypothetical protein
MDRLSLEASWRGHRGNSGRVRFELSVLTMLFLKLVFMLAMMT